VQIIFSLHFPFLSALPIQYIKIERLSWWKIAEGKARSLAEYWKVLHWKGEIVNKRRARKKVGVPL